MQLAIRDAMLDAAGFPSPLEGLRALGVEAVELNLDDAFRVPALDSRETITLVDDDDAVDYRHHLHNLGVKPCALLTARDLSVRGREENVEWLVRAVELAQLVGAPVVRVDPAMKRENELDFEARTGLFIDAMRAVIERTQGGHVALAIENHGFQGNNLTFLLNVYLGVGSPRMGSALDTGNFYWRGYPLSEVYGILRVLAPYARHTHIKNIRYPEELREKTREAGWEYKRYACSIEEGDIDHGPVVKMLHEAGYQGALCIEDESLYGLPQGGERVRRLERDVAHVRALAASIS